MTLLFDEQFRKLTASAPLTYLDAGARGGLQGPWRDADDGRLRVVSFEPESAGVAELGSANEPSHIVLAKGLWSSEGDVELHVAQTGSASSVHPPDWALLERFRRQHGEPRRTVRRELVQCTTVDLVATRHNLAIDFLKLDTQGAEYEILEGAREQLRDNVFALLCETWTQAVHRGQRVTHEVWRLLDDAGFEVVQASVAAAWQHRIVDREALRGRSHLTGLDLLAFRMPSRWSDLSLVRAVKWAAIAELYGYPDISIEILEACAPATEHEAEALANVKGLVRRTASQAAGWPRTGMLARVLRRLRRLRRGTPSGGAKLHY